MTPGQARLHFCEARDHPARYKPTKGWSEARYRYWEWRYWRVKVRAVVEAECCYWKRVYHA